MDGPRGNSCILCLFMLSNLGLLVVGFGTIAAGIYVAADLNQANWYNMSFIGLGFCTVLVFVLGCKTKRSMKGTFCYLFLTFCIFVVQLGFTLAIIFYEEFQSLLGQTNANAVRYSLLAACVIILVCFLLGWWYRNSLKKARVSTRYSDANNYIRAEEQVSSKEEPIKLKYKELREKYKSSLN